MPTSELVARQVTNWVLHDPHGRLRLQLGVAYGSDVERVRDVLLEVANEHPEVLKGDKYPKPKALFMGFGDSALDFELRVRIKRIDRRFDVSSDLNFGINAAFRENGIQIPFPQRDLHIRSWAEEAQLASELGASKGKVRELVRRRAGGEGGGPSTVQEEIDDG